MMEKIRKNKTKIAKVLAVVLIATIVVTYSISFVAYLL